MPALTDLGFPPSGTISPSVRLVEKDFSGFNPGNSFSKTALVGFASKGPIDVPTRVFNHEELFRKFGFPESAATHGNYLILAAIEFLKFGTEAWIVRVGTTDVADSDNFARTAFVDIPGSSQGPTIRSLDITNSYTITLGNNDQFRFKMNGELFSRAITIPAGTYTTSALVDQFNLKFVADDGIESFIHVDSGGNDTIAFRGNKKFGTSGILEIVSTKNAIYDTILVGQNMTAGDLSGIADRYPAGSSTINFNLAGLTNPSMIVRVSGTNDTTIDNIAQTIDFTPLVGSTPHASGVTGPIITVAEAATYINYVIDNTASIAGGFRAYTDGGLNLQTSNDTAGTRLIEGKDAKVQVDLSSVLMDDVFGFNNNAALGVTPSGISTTGFIDGDIVNSLQIDDVGIATGSLTSPAQTIMTIKAESPGIAGNSTQVIIDVDDDGKMIFKIFNAGIPVESHSNLDRNAADTSNLFYVERFINGFSDYIFIEDNSTVVGLPVPGTYSLGATVATQGSDGYPFLSGLPDSLKIDNLVEGNAITGTGLQSLAEPEKFDIDLAATPGLNSTDIINALIVLCDTTRKDCMAVIDPPFGLDAASVRKWHNGAHPLNSTKFDSSYAALYWSWVKVRDTFNKVDVFVPPSGPVLGVYANSERIGNVWDAPAGLTRGKIASAISTESFAFLKERDTLYGNRNAVNVLVDFPLDGVTVWGQKTLQRKPSALDRVNVRRLMLFLEKTIRDKSRLILFEPHDEALRQQFIRIADEVLTDVKDGRGVFNYRVQCDEELNPPEVIDRNELRARIGVQPAKAAEFIFIEFTVHKTGTFEESII